MTLDAAAWSALDYDETDRVSAVQYLGSLGCLTDGALLYAVQYQQPLSPELARTLIDAGAFDDEETLLKAAVCQSPLTLELVKLLIDAGCDPTLQNDFGWDSLVCLAAADCPVDPQVTDLFLATGCRMDLDGCEYVISKLRLRFEQILKECAEWKTK